MVKRQLDFSIDNDSSNGNDTDYQTINGRRVLRSRYLAVKNVINDEMEHNAELNCEMFGTIFGEMESLHKLVTKPREQVADAQALLDMTKSLVISAKVHFSGGLTPSAFVTHILQKFGACGGTITSTEDCSRNSISWKDIGVAVSSTFGGGYGFSTMIGPMDAKIKQRRVINRKKHVKPAELARPEELVEGSREERNDTDKNMLTMFNILRKNRIFRLENLVLNKNSFAQTAENLFALSFLVKDGRAEIKVDKAGRQLVSPRNAPTAKSVISKDVVLSHFVFRFDYNDWKLMARSVGVGEELMPHRNIQSQIQSEVPA
ncbi:non-structural maintenance of chromosomes element 4 homolog A-like isoform X2 [Cicer arietinum]|uniref:Non-structural maintenance of chromosomes element 4 n=1 Tax=Cicer arietinum TaxID=3827 RepID=A0A3Q7YD65_CICAR|nr:non-structural maintenance of chromosomes element 4 homolog A-like isoform X2 [Cicer arietinum]